VTAAVSADAPPATTLSVCAARRLRWVCGVSPVEASSGRTVRHRLNLGGDRRANNALWWIVVTRIRVDPATKAYLQRRTEAGKSKKDTIRVRKRYIAREIYRVLRRTGISAESALPNT
jgi:transposase